MKEKKSLQMTANLIADLTGHIIGKEIRLSRDDSPDNYIEVDQPASEQPEVNNPEEETPQS